MDSVGNFIDKSKDNLTNIVKSLEINIEYLDNSLWASLEESNLIIENVIKIYYDKYFLNNNDFSKINDYININNKINYKLKSILLSIIDYYESIDNTKILKDKEGSILYLNILIYLGLQLYNTDFMLIDEPKKIEKFINNILDNFAKIRFKKEKDLNKLIYSIKDNILSSNCFYKNINKLNTSDSYNLFVKLNKEDNYYKVLYEYKINDLNSFDIKDINIVNQKLKIYHELSKISFDLCYYTMFKMLSNGFNKCILFPITKEMFENNYKYFIENRNENILKSIKFVIDYSDMANDYNFINFIREKNIDLFIEVIKSIETNNYNMFMDVKNIVVNEDFLNINEKYLEIWKDMNLNFIVKNMENKINEKDLLKGK